MLAEEGVFDTNFRLKQATEHSEFFVLDARVSETKQRPVMADAK